MKDPVDRFVRAAARRDAYALLVVQFATLHLVVAGGLALLTLYQPMSGRDFLILLITSQAFVVADNLISMQVVRTMWRPVRAWTDGQRDPETTVAAWQALATLPIQYMRRMRRYPLLLGMVPYCAFVTWKLGLAPYQFPIMLLGGCVVLACGVIVRYFGIETTVRPLLEVISRQLPADFTLEVTGLPLRWRLLVAAPIINVIAAVVVAGLTARGHHENLTDLGAAVLIAVVVSFTISLDLVLLVSRSLLATLDDLRRGTESVADGDYSVRVPVAATDETGALAQSFNHMAEGLNERERLREAFGAYVDPGLAERVLREGSDLAGEEVEVSILFLDIRDFTEFAEHAEPDQVVALLNELWGLVVPMLLRHGGHANKFIGDGLLGVFGAPDRHPDHADRAVSAALEIAARVREHYAGRVGVGIGVNSGRVVAGTVGGGGRVEFTVIGDAVNTAARVEAATRETGDEVLITDATRERLTDGWGEFAPRPSVPMKGKTERVGLWAPPPVAGPAGREARAASVSE